MAGAGGAGGTGGTRGPMRDGRVWFTFEARDGTQEQAIIALEKGKVSVKRGVSGQADLHVTTDGDACGS